MTIIGLKDLLQSTMVPAVYPVRGLFAEGVTLLGGRPKLGKSWLILNVVTAVTTGSRAFGYFDTDPGDVLYADLENGQRRIRDRLLSLFPNPEQAPAALNRCSIRHDLPDKKAGIAALDQWADSVPAPRMVVIDTLGSWRTGTASGTRAETKELSPLQVWANARRIAVVVLHHTRKNQDWKAVPDAFASTSALTGAADNLLVLEDRNGPVVLHMEGRDIERAELAVERDGEWLRIGGAAASSQAQSTRAAILRALGDAAAAKAAGNSVTDMMRPFEISSALGISHEVVRQEVRKMLTDGLIEQPKYAHYAAIGAGPKRNRKIHSSSKTVEQTEGYEAPATVNATVKSEVAEAEIHSPNDPLSTRDTTIISDGVKGGEENTDRFLKWLFGAGGNAAHRQAQQALTPALKGEDILLAANHLASLGQVEVTVDGRSRSYRLTPAGREAARGPQIDLLEFLGRST